MVLVGFTIPKSFGNAPQRNRMRRRLRAALGEVANRSGLPEGLVLLGAQPTALTMPFDDLSQHVERLFAQASEATQ